MILSGILSCRDSNFSIFSPPGLPECLLYNFCDAFLPVTSTFSALTTITKSPVSRVRLIPGNGLIKINGRSGDDYLNFNPLHLNSIKAPLQTLGLENSYDILVNVFGGGLTGQADAIKQGAARALCELSPDNRKPLKTEGHLSRDPRAKERRKYGLKKARKAPQFSKR